MGFVLPPLQDFDAYARLVDSQAAHFQEMVRWAGQECSDASDLNSALLWPVAALAPRIAEMFVDKLAQCRDGMSGVAGKSRATGDAYASAESANRANLASLFGAPLPGFPDIGAIPELEHLGNFVDEDVTLKEPDPAGDDTARNIRHQLLILGFGADSGAAGLKTGLGLSGSIGNFSGKILSMGDRLFQYFTGQSLVELLFRPIVGDYGRLKFLEESCAQLGDGLYTVAGTLRKGSVRLGGEWQGDAAVAFDSLMFRWSMGVGGLGDAAQVMSRAYRDGYYAVCSLVQAALQAITRLINVELRNLVETAAEDAAIEAVGGGPEDPVADAVAVAWTLYKIYRAVKAVITVVQAIIAIYHDIETAAGKIVSDIQAVIQVLSGPIDVQAAIDTLLDDIEQRTFEFERNGGWDPDLGAIRVLMLPSP
ncbi:MAG: WXG100 family type VII secretion target [Frankiaceae bacterium]|jgi:uncharacterized protein YukE|nr:WXG100 family type VII secretion target [Frankiaceae bacterium]